MNLMESESKIKKSNLNSLYKRPDETKENHYELSTTIIIVMVNL